jgi:hypothetical protein
MGIFSFLKKDQNNNRELLSNEGLQASIPIASDIVMEEGNKPKDFQQHDSVVGLETIYKFLQSDFESKGYNDALINPDDSYKTDNFLLIKYDLQILLHQVGTYHDDLLRELDFHIQSRSRAGLIDLVEELKNRKEMVNEHVSKVLQIKKELESESGMTQRILLSYQRGFMKGLSAITQSNVLNKQF